MLYKEVAPVHSGHLRYVGSTVRMFMDGYWSPTEWVNILNYVMI